MIALLIRQGRLEQLKALVQAAISPTTGQQPHRPDSAAAVGHPVMGIADRDYQPTAGPGPWDRSFWSAATCVPATLRV